MRELKIKYLKYDCWAVHIGDAKRLLLLKNCDVINSCIAFSIIRYNNFNISLECDVVFWKRWIDFYSEISGIKKNISFKNSSQKAVFSNKQIGEHLFYSSGKDSYLSFEMRPSLFRTFLIDGGETFVPDIGFHSTFMHTNVFDILVNELETSEGFAKVGAKYELLLPLMSRYNTIYLGLEKENWSNSFSDIGFNVSDYAEILSEGHIYLDSIVKDYNSLDILKKLKGKPFLKCNTSVEDFCYLCYKCLVAYYFGANMDNANFDRKKVEENIFRNRGFSFYTNNVLIKDRIGYLYIKSLEKYR